jgi:aryl-alcohol dehydrogenase
LSTLPVRAVAAVVERAGAPFTLCGVDVEHPRADEVLVRMVSVGICGTDLEFAELLPTFPSPALLGHEGAGIVERVGSSVRSVQPGDRVALSFTSCGSCPMCRTGAQAYCRQFDALNFTGRRADGTSAVSRDGVSCNAHFIGQSSFASYAVVPERAVVVLPADADLTIAGPFGCAIQTGVGTVLNVLRPKSGQSIGVFGVGAVGAAAVMGARLAGCRPLIAIDVNRGKLDAASRFGATDVVDAGADDVASALRRICPNGLDYVIDTTGRDEVLRTAVEALGPLGKAAVVGAGPSRTMTLDWNCVLHGRMVIGVIGGSSVPQVFVPELLALHRAGQLPVEGMVTLFPFAQINEAADAARRGEVTKAILQF